MVGMKGLVVAGALACLLPFAAAAGKVDLATYLAEYDLSLADQQQDQDIAGISGLLVVEFRGSSCSGYINDGRTVTAIDTFEGDRLVTDTRSHTVEHPDGKMEFSSETFADGAQIEASSGTARRDGDGVVVDLVKPEETSIVLPGALVFPTEQVIRVVAAALEEQRFVTMDIFDGSQNGRLVYQTATIIGATRHGAIDDGEESLISASGMDTLAHWPVTISYFEKTDDRSDSTPDFVMSFELYQNGIARGLLIDYGEFSMRGRLTSLTMLPEPVCD
ncbi:MAG: EipB family protein [Alphaproteobacteria bacterium]